MRQSFSSVLPMVVRMRERVRVGMVALRVRVCVRLSVRVRVRARVCVRLREGARLLLELLPSAVQQLLLPAGRPA